MAKGFNLTAEINLRGPSNIKNVVSGIRKQLGNIGVNVNPTVSQGDIKNIATSIRTKLANINIPINVTASSTSIKSLATTIRRGLGNISAPVDITVSQRSIAAARRSINSQLTNINATVTVTVNPASARNATALNTNLGALNQTLNSITTSATSATTAIQNLSAAMRAASGGANSLSQINTALNVVSNNATATSASMRQFTGEVENFGRQAGLAIRRFAAFSSVTAVFYGLGRAVQSGLSSFIEFDRQLVRISQVTGDSGSNLDKLEQTLTSLARTYGVSSQELAGVSLTLAQAGLTAKETEQALKALARTALAPSFDDMNNTVEGSIALMRQFGIGTNQLEQALGSVNAVAAKFAVEASDIIAAIQRTGGVFAAASRGVSEGTDALNEFVAVFTSVRATTRESAETIATGLRTIFTRIQRGSTVEALKDFGVNLTDVEGKFVGAYKAVQLLSEGLSRLDPRDLRFSQIVEELGGFRQIGKVIPLIQQFSTAQQALNVAQAGSGSLAEDAAKGQLALAVQIAKVREEFLGFIRSVGDTSSFRTLVKLGLDLASSLISVADAAKELIPLIGAFAAFRGAQSLTRFASGFVGGVRGTAPRGFASGGYVPGQGNSDTVPAMLTPGEFVIRKKAVQKIGVSRLATLNRNNGGPVPTQYFEDGGPVQRFADGKFVMPKARGSRGARGARGPKGFQPLSSEEYAKWSKQIYSQWENDPSLPMDRYMGIPMPKPIAEYQRKTRKYALESGGAGLALGRDAKGREVIAKFGKAKETEEKLGKLKKTPLGLIFSAAGLRRGPRAPAGQMEKVMTGYQGSSEFQKETSGAGSTLFATLKGPLSSFKKGGTFGGVITPGSESATKIKGALEKLLAQSSGQDAIKAKTALDKFDSFIAGATPEKAGHVSHFTWAMNQIFKKGIATFRRGGRASRRMGVFDFDMTTGITKQKETPSLSGFKNPKLAVPDILSATPTGLVQLMKKYGASQILTARSGGPKGEMRTALGTFFRRNGVMLPSSNITTLGDQVGSLSTAEKKARALYAMVKKYGGVDFFDDDQANIDAAKMVRGVSARKVSVMKNLGGVVQKFMAGKAVKGLPDLPKDITALITREARLGIGKEDPALQSALLNLVAKRNKSVGTTELANRLANLIRSNELTPNLANQMLSTGGLRIPTGPGGKATIQALSLEALGPKDQTRYTRSIGGREVDIVRGSPTADLSSRMTRDLMQGARIGLARFIRTGLTEYAMQSPENRQALIDSGVKFDSKGRAIPPKAAIDSAMAHGDVGGFIGPLFERGIIGLGAKAGPNVAGKAAPIDTSKVGDVVASIMRGGAPISSEFPTELRASKAKTRASRGVPDASKRGLVNQILRFFKLPGLRFAQGGSVPGIRTSRAREAILGKQLNGVEMIRAARRAGYDIEELDNGLIQLSRNNKIMHTLSRPEVSKLLGSISTGYNLGGIIQKFASGGSPEDTVPALLTPGEFVINKKAAKRIGGAKLNRLNKADKISGFNSGGAVGSIPRYSLGGDVQRFFFGGRASARPGADATTQNLMISGNVNNQLRELINALQELGIQSSASADLLRRGGRVSVEAANAAYEADILRMRVAGAPMDAVIQAETRLAEMRQQGRQQVAAQRQLSGVGGAQLERVDTAAQQNIQRMIQRAQAAGVDLDENQRRRIEDLGYRRAAQTSGLSGAQTAGLSGNDIRQFINTAMGDPRTFEQMNRQFEARRRQELNNQYIAENRFGGDRRRILEQASRDAAEEARIRRQTLNQTRGTAGPGGTAGQRMQQGMFAASFALPMIAQMLAGDPSRATSAGGAAMSAGIQGGANALALGTMLSSLVPPGLPQLFVGVATAAGAVAQGLIDARNATIEFEKNMASKRVEFALADSAKLFEKLSKDIKNIDVQNAIGEKLAEASSAAERSIEIQSNTAKAFWVNMMDAFAENGKEAAQRAQVLERFGTAAYLSTTTIGQSFMGGQGTAEQRANLSRSNFAAQMAPEQSRDIARQFAEIADGANRLLEEKIRSGTNIEEYLNTDEFKGLSEAIALSNAAIGEQILRIRTSTFLTDAQKNAQEQLIISTYAEQEARKRAAVVSRELEIKAAQKATNQLARSLDRMFGNMEQAINKTNFGLEKMSRDLDLVSSSLTGQAKAGERSIQAINVLQNPRAYGSGEVGRARSQAAGFFGDSGNIVRGLLTLGDDIEANIMGSINKALRDVDDESPGRIAIAVEKGVKDKLASLALPKDVSDKLAREVSRALEEIRKEGDDQADFTQIEEKLQNLSQIVDSTTKAQEIAIKALETWQNALNSYSSSMNSLVDLQIDYQARLRKSTEILLDGQESLARALGRDISLESVVDRRNMMIGQQTGGATSPQDIFRNIGRLELLRTQQEAASDVAAQRGPSAAKDFIDMQNNLRFTNVALRENFDALKNLAENSNVASAALGKIQEAQQRQQGRVSFIEKLVTSTPEELDNLNRSFIRLQNNMSGQVNTINNSVGAQKAYVEAIRGGASAFEAMKAAQAAFANERRETLSALNDLLPFLGGGERANQIRANTLESMLAESGVGASPMFQDILNALRNPELDPETQRAVALYEQANVLQAQANDFLAQINVKLGEETADKAAQAIATALSNVVLTFKNAEQADINRGLIPQNRARGGIIYAAKGMFTPKGTDTVPAMLTPGEFVVNKSATAKNLPLLKSINSQSLSTGGPVKYYAGGGLVSSFLSTKASSRSDFGRTKEEFLDLDDESVSKLLADSRTSLFLLPNSYIRLPSKSAIDQQTPSRDKPSDQATYDRDIDLIYGRRAPGIYDLNKIYNSKGDIVPGWLESGINIVENGPQSRGNAPIAYPIDRGSVGRIAPLMIGGAANPFKILGLDSTDVDLQTIKYDKQKLDEYKQRIEKLKNTKILEKLAWSNDPADFRRRTMDMAKDGYPENITPIDVSKNTFNANSRERNNILYASDMETPPDQKLIPYATIRSNNAMREAFAVTAGVSEASFNDTARFDKIVSTIYASVFDVNKDKALSPDKIKTVTDYTKKQYNVVKQTIEAANKGFAGVELEDSADLGKYEDLQTKLARLYNNSSAFESFNDLSLFANPLLSNAKSLTVTSNNAVSRSDILRYIQNQQTNLAAGAIPTNNGNPITVGISDALPPGLQDSVKKWVKKSEFDIFSSDGIAPPKRFPFLVNADVADLGEAFVKRAADAILAQKDAIETSMFIDNNKIRIPLNAGKNIDLPYSATYTKYTGPLWNPDTNTFSDDVNQQLKDVFLPDTGPAKSIFSNLDTTRDRLFKQGGPFDLNNITKKIPTRNISNLIDLVKNGADQNLIDKEVQNIQNQASLTFDHIGNFEGSLIKLQRAIGKEAFVGYSALPDTTIGFGEFLAQGVLDYAKNQKQEAGIAAGRAQGAGAQAQDVIADKSMALKQLTQGALQIFGSRPIPGLSRGWLSGSIRPLLGLMSRQNRGKAAPLSNDQARNAAAYIRDIMNNAGAYVSNISGRVTNPLLYNGLKDTFTLMWGAYKSFDSLAKSDTRQLGQMLKSNVDVESIFRSFGSAAMFDKIAMSELSGDYKAMLGQQLQGSKIATVDDNGNIKLQDAAALEFKNYKELMGLAINPYSEFSSINTRKGIFNKLMDDISGAVDNRGMPYFDPNTLNFLLTSLDQLRKWYGGSGAWVGQDYLFDKTVNADPKIRSQIFLDSLKNAQGIYGLSNVAYQNLGGSTRFGRELPAEEWFKNRIDAGNFATGGMVYASGGTLVNYQPRGTDTVPAMLTPGEFVVNRSATRKNLPLLQQINSGYMAEGGMATNNVSRLRWTPDGRTREVEKPDTISPKLNAINKSIMGNSVDIKLVQKDIKELKDSLKNLNIPIAAVQQLNAQIGELQSLTQAVPSFLYEQLIVSLRNLWNTLGPALTAVLAPGGGAWPAAPFSTGGPVYASKGQLINFQPKGTDTVPAMLTPGEFVVNRAATQKNLPLLKSINSGVGGYSRGGVVYLQDGGVASSSFNGISDRDNELLRKIIPQQSGVEEFTKEDVLRDKNAQQFFEDHLRKLRVAGAVGESYQNWDRRWESEGINYTAALISAGRELAPTIGAGLVAAGTYTTMASPATGPALPVTAAIGSIIAGIGTYMLARGVQGKLIEDNIKTADGTLRDTLDKIAAENPASTALGAGAAGIATGGIPQLGRQGLKMALAGAGITTALAGGRKVLDGNLAIEYSDVIDILTSAVPGSQIGNISDNLARTASSALAALPIVATFRNSDAAAAILRRQKPSSRSNISAGRISGAMSAAHVGNVGEFTGADLVNLLNNLYASEQGMKSKLIRYLALDVFPSGEPSTLKGAIERISKNKEEANRIASNSKFRTIQGMLIGLPAPINQKLKSTGNGVLGSDLQQFFKEASPDQIFRGRKSRDSNYVQPIDENNPASSIQAIIGALDPNRLYKDSEFTSVVQNLIRDGKLSPPKKNATDILFSSLLAETPNAQLTDAQRQRLLDYGIDPKNLEPRITGRERPQGSRAQSRIENIDPRMLMSAPDPQSIMTNTAEAFKRIVGVSQREQIVRNVFDSVAGQVARSSPEFSVNQLTALLNSQITTSGAIKTIADVTRLLGLPPANVIPENLSLAIREASDAQGALGTWLEATGTMALARPNKNVSNDNRTVAHEVGHSLLRRFGDQVYGNFQTKMQENIGLIREYMIQRPDLFGSYDKSTIGAGLYYTLKGLVPLGESTDIQSAIKTWANLYNSRDNLPLTSEQLQKLREFYTKFKEGDTISPDVSSSYDFRIPGMPRINASDITPDGKLFGFVRGRAEAIKGLFDLSAEDPSPVHLEKIKALYDQFQLGPNPNSNFNENVAVAREEFLTQMLQNVDKLDTKGLRILTELLDGTLKETGLFDANSFYDRMRNILNQRSRIPGQPPPLPGTSITIPPRMEQETPLMRKNGGVVYASKGQLINFQPKGTDTVPAMLTPGEFVVNRAATQKNLPLLKSINNGASGYSDGGIAYLAAGGQTKADDRKDIMNLKGKLTTQMTARSSQQMMEANKNRQGTLWAFSSKVQNADGTQSTGFVLRDPNNANAPAPPPAPGDNSNIQTESLMANRLDQIFTIRARNEKEAMEAYKALDLVGLLPDAKPIPAVKALDEARRKWMQQPLYAKVLDELAYQISLDPSQFAVFNPNFFNPAVNIDANTKPIIDAANAIDPNNPQSIALGVPVILSKLKPIMERINYLRKIVKNNEQAMLVFSAANLDFTKSENMRKAFGGKFPTDIHDAQIKGGKAEIAGGEQILAKLGQNQTLFALGNDPRFQMMLSMIGSGPGVAVSTFERQVQQASAPPKLLASGGKVTYARNGQLINFAPQGTDTVPAMLTPGEFVVNREAAQKHLSLLHSINNNRDVLALNRGGYITPSYFENGGTARSSNSTNIASSIAPAVLNITNQIKSAIQDAFKQAINSIESSQERKPSNGVSSDSGRDLSRIESFSNSLNNLANRLENISIPPQIQFTGKQDVNVNVNGMQNVNIDSEIGKIAANTFKNAISKLATNNPGTLDFNIDYS